MLKLTDSSYALQPGEQAVTILDLTSASKGLEKVAADSRIQEFSSKITPKPGKAYLHINAMGASEYYGSNRNSDWFPEEDLIKYHHTFVTSPAHLFRHHVNKNPAIAQGVVIFSVYNERMHRVELIVEASKDLVKDIEDKLTRGEAAKTSMACKTSSDVCNICGNVASNRAEYCTHLRNELGRMYPDGRKVSAINSNGLRFFDISLVTVPADPTSSILTKIAGEVPNEVIGSAELAELEGLTEKQAHVKSSSLKKVAELVKEITDGAVVDVLKLPKAADPDLAHYKGLTQAFSLSQILAALAKSGISPSIAFLAELIAYKHIGTDLEGIGPLVEEALKAEPNATVEVPSLEENHDEPATSSLLLDREVAKSVPGSSLFSDPIEKRASGVGFFGNGPHVEPLYSEQYYRPESPSVVSSGMEPLKVLLELGVAALLCKHFIHQEMSKQAKISLTKKASSDYQLASAVGKSALTPYGTSTEQDKAKNTLTVNRIANKLASRILRTKSQGAATALKLGNMIFGNIAE